MRQRHYSCVKEEVNGFIARLQDFGLAGILSGRAKDEHGRICESVGGAS